VSVVRFSSVKVSRFGALSALVPLACSLTSSIDDLGANAGKDAGADQSVTGGSGGSGGSKTGGTGGGSGGTVSGGGTAGSGGAVFPDASDPCVSQANCNACCATSHGEGQQLFVAAIKKCVCQEPSCSSSCTEYCGGGQLTKDCSDCVSSQLVQACIAKECHDQCKVYTDCVSGCP